MKDMLNKIDIAVLNSCCNDQELFYFLFAEANFGGQCFDKNEVNKINFSGHDIIKSILKLSKQGLLSCWLINNDKKELVNNLTANDLKIYEDYNCVLFEDHVQKYGHGPHEFKTSYKGLKEIR